MSDSAIDDRQQVSNARPRRLRFSLLTLLIVVTALGAILGTWYFYRPLSVNVDIRFAVIDTWAAQSLLAGHEFRTVEESPYRWAFLGDQELVELLTLKGRAAPSLAVPFPQAVTNWPRTAFARTYISPPNWVPLDGTAFFATYESGRLDGFVGSRMAGTQRQIRVECNVAHQHDDTQAISGAPEKVTKEVKGKLFYEGAREPGHLVFAAPIDNDVYHVVIFDVK